MSEIKEAITVESDLLLKLNPISEIEIFEFMKNLRGGTYFNMGMYSSIPVAKAYKSTIRIYKVIDLTAIVSGVSYENIGTTKDFRDRTGEAPGKAWYDHTPGFEHKVGQKKSDPNSKYVLWDIKKGTGTTVRYYVVDIDTGAVTPVSKADVEASPYLTATEKAKLTPKPVVGIDLTTGEAVENKTNWRTAAFEHIFWLSQAGKATQEYGVRFEEDLGLAEALGDEIFIDAHAGVRTYLDAILAGEVVESVEKPLEEAAEDVFMDAHAGVKTKLDDVLSGAVVESKELKENSNSIKVRCAEVTYEDDDGYDCHVGVLADNLDEDEIIDKLYDSGMMYVEVLSFYEGEVPADQYGKYYTPGTVVDVFEDLDEDHKAEKTSLKADLKESYRRTVSRGNSLVDNELFVDFD